jgi:predicted ribosome quality control (RQC) complex YloA/Tae2 family protein
MPFDGLAMRAVALELRDKLTGGRVEKVSQPERDELVLHIRSNYETHKLLISASANNARVHLTKQGKPNPERAPVFCMLLRKRLIGGRLLDVSQRGLERVLDLRFGVVDELGLASELTLHAEAMGRHSNAVLTQPDGRIVDSLKRVTEEKSRVREVLPGIPYGYPPSQNKMDPLEMDAGGFLALLESRGDMPMEKALSGGVCGIAQATASELLQGCGLNPALSSGEYTRAGLIAAAEALHEKFGEFRAGHFTPVVIEMGGEITGFFPFAGAFPQRERSCESISEAAEAFYAGRDRKERLRQKSANMLHTLTGALDRARRKLDNQESDLKSSQNLEDYRLKGELLTANLHAARKGQRVFEADNYYGESGEKVSIELDPALSPSENAQRYYKKYAKAKTAQDKLAVQIAAVREEIEYLEGLLESLENCASEAEMEEVRAEMASQGYIRNASAGTGRKPEPSLPRHYRTAGGADIYVGRNNMQNDFLTLKFARADDTWMHAKKIPGSHVIVRAAGGDVPEEALFAGAMLAAYYSKARSSSSVPVDYTQKRNVKKPAGARPGYVIYLTNRTMTVTPDEGFLSGLKEVKD